MSLHHEMHDEKHQAFKADVASSEIGLDELINVSGHVQELDRTHNLWSIFALAVTTDNAWACAGGSLVVALYNGGGPGVLYGLIAVTICYCFIGASLAELCSAIPSSANVYHWASITPGPRYGRICSWYAGWWNMFGWIVGCASQALFVGEAVMALYSLYHPGFQVQRWQTFVVYVCACIFTSLLVLFGQQIFARSVVFLGSLLLLFGFATILTCAIAPSRTGYGYASNAFVWSDWQNLTGWSSNGFVFLAGMLNGAFTIGTPDGVCHLCEEVPNPRVNIPKSIAIQLLTGFLTSFIFLVSILYGVTSLEDVFDSNIPSLPLAAIFEQVTRSRAGTAALLIIWTLDIISSECASWVTAGRMLWTLARDDATPFAAFLGKVSPRWRNPFNAQLACTGLAIALGCIYLASETAFNAFIGVFAIFSTLSFLAAILPYLLTARKYIARGPFWMPGAWGLAVSGVACAYMISFNVIYMFPATLPVTLQTMNWDCVIVVGATALVSLWYLWKRNHGYIGPRVAMHAQNELLVGTIGPEEQRVLKERDGEGIQFTVAEEKI